MLQDGRTYDGTMRVGFALCLKASNAQESLEYMPPPDALKVAWLGGYWKYPAGDLLSDDLRARCISAARSAGTAPVSRSMLHEVYAALGDSLQRLFGGPEPSPQDLTKTYRKQPELAAYLIARLALASNLPMEQVKTRLVEAERVMLEVPDSHGKSCVTSFLNRCRGVCEIKPFGQGAGKECWEMAHPHFQRSISSQPNANALFWFGMYWLNSGRQLDAAIALMRKSLLLDPDFKGPYVNLGVAYLRHSKYEKAIEISRAGLARFPDSPQCHYHIAVASYQKAFRLFEVPQLPPQVEITSNVDSSSFDITRFVLVGTPYTVSGSDDPYRSDQRCGTTDELTTEVRGAIRLLLSTVAEEMDAAREHDEGQKRINSRQKRSPWLKEDEAMYSAAKGQAGCGQVDLKPIEVPASWGWRFMNYRI